MLTLCLVTATAAADTSCRSNDGDATSPHRAGRAQTLIYGRGNDSRTLDPFMADEGETTLLIDNLYEPLVEFAADSTDVLPCLATAWTVSEDQRTWTFTLRDGVVFHNGDPLTPEDVRFTLDRLFNDDNAYRFGQNSPYAYLYEDFDGVRVVDGRRVAVTLNHPSAVCLANLAMFPASIVSKRAVIEHGRDFGNTPAGTGPFMIEQWTPRVKIVVRRFDGYWRDKPAFDRIVFQPIPENAARRARLEKGEIDFMDNVNFADVDALRAAPGVKVLTQIGMNLGFLAINTHKPPLTDVRVRRAIAHAIDKSRINIQAYAGVAETGPNPLPPTIWSYNNDIHDYAYDPDHARRLLRDAGVAPGTPLEFWTMTNPRPYMPLPQRVAQIIKDNLTAVGFHVVLRPLEWGTYLDRTKRGEQHLALYGWSTDNGDPDNFLYALLSADTIGSNNICFYDDPRFTDLIDRARRLLDRTERETLYRDAQDIVHRDCPLVPLVYCPQVVATRTRVGGYVVHPMGIRRLRHITLDR
ncbi:MAG: ABC transporter substrate-binding protein [Phycisphaerae bacterium]